MQSPQLYFSFLSLLIFFLSVSRSLSCSNPPKSIIVDQSGQRESFKTIQSAINSIPTRNTKWIHIQIFAGIYTEKVNIPQDKPCIFLEGAGRTSTIIKWSDHDQMSTSATFSFIANDIVVKGITFVNTYNRPPTPLLDTKGNKPALAATVQGDRSAFFECAFKGVQDTLWDQNGRHYFRNCYIQGGVDFIFGNGQSIYEECVIHFTMGGDGPQHSGGYITAQARDSKEEPTGFVFKECIINGNVRGQVFLGRAYRPFARVIIANSYLTDVVAAAGWNAWNGTDHEENITFVEEGNKGAGADKSKRVPWLRHMNGEELNNFLSKSKYIDQEGWISKLPVHGY